MNDLLERITASAAGSGVLFNVLQFIVRLG